MNKSATIRSLAKEGLSVADIARRVGVRYQFAWNVLLAAGLLTTAQAKVSKREATSEEARRPELTEALLSGAGFEKSSRWVLSSDGLLKLERPLPKSPGVYSMVKNRKALYVGLASMGLAKRFYFYARPGKTQKTSLRINALLRQEVAAASIIDIYTATPPNLEWSGLPVSGIAGLELGLIEAYVLPWNIRGVKG